MQRGQLLSREAGRSVPNPSPAPNKKQALMTRTMAMCCGSATFGRDLCAAAIPPHGIRGAVRNGKLLVTYMFLEGEKKMKRNVLAGAVVSALGLLAGSEVHAA